MPSIWALDGMFGWVPANSSAKGRPLGLMSPRIEGMAFGSPVLLLHAACEGKPPRSAVIDVEGAGPCVHLHRIASAVPVLGPLMGTKRTGSKSRSLSVPMDVFSSVTSR